MVCLFIFQTWKMQIKGKKNAAKFKEYREILKKDKEKYENYKKKKSRKVIVVIFHKSAKENEEKETTGRTRGRKRKSEENLKNEVPTKKKRGRPRKNAVQL